MHVLFAGLNDRARIVLCFSREFFQRAIDRSGLFAAQHARGAQRARPGDRPGDVLLHQPPIDRQRVIELPKKWVGLALESSTPERHAEAFLKSVDGCRDTRYFMDSSSAMLDGFGARSSRCI